MPTYEYTCDACHEHFERQQSIKDDPIKECPSCGETQARRMISSGNFILKGGGWYSDLYSGPSNRKQEESKGQEQGSTAESSNGSQGESDKGQDKSEGSTKSEGSGSSESSGKGGDKAAAAS